jgi:bifunctional DNA-binding transcriptional regulator/antitoxin component of YhaV-PrlF toxin-antitoxin module
LDKLFWVAFLKPTLRSLQAASIIVSKSQSTSAKGEANMPLTQKISLKTVLQKGNRVQVPKLVRWQFKLDTEQVLKVTVNAVNVWGSGQTFYAQMNKSGRITVPKLQLELLRGEEQDLVGCVMDVVLEPAEG